MLYLCNLTDEHGADPAPKKINYKKYKVINMKSHAKIEKMLQQLKKVGYIEKVKIHNNHFVYRIKELDTKEQKQMIKDKIEDFIQKTEYKIFNDWNTYVIYDYSIIENLLNEENYEHSTAEYSFVEVKGYIGDKSYIALRIKEYEKYTHRTQYDIEKQLGYKYGDTSKLDSRIKSISTSSDRNRITIQTFKGEKYAKNKSWCKIENTKDTLDIIFKNL